MAHSSWLQALEAQTRNGSSVPGQRGSLLPQAAGHATQGLGRRDTVILPARRQRRYSNPRRTMSF